MTLISITVNYGSNSIEVLWDNEGRNHRKAYVAGMRNQFEADLGAIAAVYVPLIDWDAPLPDF